MESPLMVSILKTIPLAAVFALVTISNFNPLAHASVDGADKKPQLVLSEKAGAAFVAQAGEYPTPPPECGSSYPGYAIQQFQDLELRMLDWNARYSRAPSGSFEERDADFRRREAGDSALQVLRSGYGLGDYPLATLERFATELGDKYSRAPSGSYIETIYNSGRRLAWDAYQAKGERNLSCYGLAWESARDGALYFDQLYNRAPSGSLSESAYRSLRLTAWNRATALLNEWFRYSNTQDFRSLDRLAQEFHSLYNQASSGSQRETFYNSARRIAWDTGLEQARRNFPYLSTQELSSIQVEFNSCYQRSPSGSLQENFCRNVRDLAQQELQRRGGGGEGSGGGGSDSPRSVTLENQGIGSVGCRHASAMLNTMDFQTDNWRSRVQVRAGCDRLGSLQATVAVRGARA